MRRFALLIAVLAIGLMVACGGDNESNGVNGSDDSEANETTTGGSASEAGGDFCDGGSSAEVFEKLDFDSSLNPSDLATQLSGADGLLNAWIETAPPEIRDDVAIMAEGFRTMIEVIEEYDYDIAASEDDPRVDAITEDERFPAARDRVSEFCGLS